MLQLNQQPVGTVSMFNNCMSISKLPSFTTKYEAKVPINFLNSDAIFQNWQIQASSGNVGK
jgi:hypothetical protein